MGGITVRQGAAPGELFTLASMLASAPRGDDVVPFSSDTPTTLSSIGAEPLPRELLRSWSVLVTPAERPTAHLLLTPAEGLAAISATMADGAGASPTVVALTRLASSHSDEAANAAVDQLVQLLDDAELRGEARVVEGIARACMEMCIRDRCRST